MGGKMTASTKGRRRSLRGRAAIIGIGETQYFKWGTAVDSEFKMALQAVLAAARDAGISPRDIDGFASYSDDRNAAIRLAAALDLPELRYAGMVWGGGGGGGSGAVLNASMAVATGVAECVVVFRGLAQGQFGRFGLGRSSGAVRGEAAFTNPYGLFSAAQMYAMRYQRWMHDHGGVGLEAQKAVSLASYHHAQANPRAVMYGRPLTSEGYDQSRWIVEPWRLFDCCQENDGAAALVIVPAEVAADLSEHPAYVLAAAQGADRRFAAPVHNGDAYASADFRTVAPRLWEMAGLTPADVDVIQSYENFTGGVVMSLVEHGICTGEEVDEVLTVDNLLAPSGRLPLNTSGGNLAECYMHGLELILEAVRQVRGQSCNQVPGANVALVGSGPMVAPVSDLLVGSGAVL
jgi:acetyl-CoA acetyltransferase